MKRKEDIKNELEKRLRETAAFLAGWQAVTFPTKKDGSPFAVMSKNISGARYTPETYALQPGEYELTICVVDETDHCRRYVTDFLRVHCFVDDLDEKKRAKTQNFQPATGGLRQIYTYDLEDIKEAITARIDHLERRKAALTAQLEKLDTVYDYYEKSVNDLEKTLKDITGYNDGFSDLYYQLTQR